MSDGKPDPIDEAFREMMAGEDGVAALRDMARACAAFWDELTKKQGVPPEAALAMTNALIQSVGHAVATMDE